MQLKTYRDQNDLTLVDIMKRLRALGMSVGTPTVVQRHEVGLRWPDIEMMEAYRKITKGAVTYADWVELKANAKALAKRRTPAAPKPQLENATS